MECARCSRCAKDLSSSSVSSAKDDETEIALHPSDDSFVLCDALDGPGGRGGGTDLLGAPSARSHTGHADAEVTRRTRRERRRALGPPSRDPGYAAAAGFCAEACAHCTANMNAFLERKASEARGQAAAYVRSEREHALREESETGAARSRRERRDDDADAVVSRDALGAAVVAARAEARAVRAERAAVRGDAAALDAEERRLCEDAAAHAGDVERFRDRCAALLCTASTRRDEDQTLDALAERLDGIDLDKAAFAQVDAYVRETCKRLERKTDDKKIIGTPMGGGGAVPAA